MPRVFWATVIAIAAVMFASHESRAACGKFTLASPSSSHEARFNDMDKNGEISVGDSLVGERILDDAAGKAVAELYFVGTVSAVDKQARTALRSTKYVYHFADGTVFGARDFVLPVADFKNPPGKALTSHVHDVPIIGGTGAYADARGKVDFELDGQGGGVYTFEFICDLVGTWIGKTTIALESDGKIVETPRILTIVIEKVNGNLVKGFRMWRSPDDKDPGYVGERATTRASEPFIGSLSSDGDELRLVEVEDKGILVGEILGPDRIEFTYMETAPHPVVYTAIFRRKKK